MHRVYSGLARRADGTVFEARIMAASLLEAEERLRGRRVEPIDLKLRALETIEVGFKEKPEFRELAQFYRTLGRRIERGADLRDAVRDGGEYAMDPLLKGWLNEMQEEIDGGLPLAEAMKKSGFPVRDSALVQAMSGAGRTPRAFMRLAEEYEREGRMAKRLRSLAVQPTVFFVISTVFVLLATVFALPKMERFFSELPNMSLPSYAKHVYSMANAFDAHLWVSVPLYVGIAVGLLWWLRSRQARHFIERFPSFRHVIERADAATALGAFALLYEAAIPRDQAARMTGQAASRIETREAFERLSNEIAAGRPNTEAARRAGFPAFIERQIIRALSAGDADATVEGLTLLASNMADDTESLTKRLEDTMYYLGLALMAGMLLSAFFVILYPIMSSALRQV
ncbi:MAG: type II secretion system F family protein [Acidiferrobacterales bacterium]